MKNRRNRIGEEEILGTERIREGILVSQTKGMEREVRIEMAGNVASI